MAKAIIPLGYSATQVEIDAGVFDTKSGGTIQVIDGSGQPTGVQYDVGATGSAPTQIVTGGNINTMLATAGGVGWEKVQITTASYQLKPSTSGASRDFHVETGGSLAVLVVVDWPLPASPKVDVFKVRNFSGSTKTFDVMVGVGQYSGIVTHDNDSNTPATTSYTIHNDSMVVVSIDSDGWVQVVPSAEVSQAEFDTGLAGKSDTTHSHTGTYEPANTNIQTHVTAAHAPITAEENVQSDWNATTGDALILNKPTIPPAITTQQANALATIQAMPVRNMPTMTSNTTAGTLGNYIASASSSYVSGDYPPWSAMRGVSSGGPLNQEWACGAQNATVWLRLQYPSAKTVTRIKVRSRGGVDNFPIGWKLQGSNNGTAFTDLYTSATAMQDVEETVNIANTTAYLYYRIEGYNAGSWAGMRAFWLYEDQFSFPAVAV